MPSHANTHPDSRPPARWRSPSPPAGPFALATVASGARTFAGMVVGTRVRDLSDLDTATGQPVTVRGLLKHWAASLAALLDLVDDPGGSWHALADLRVLPPLEPGLVLQAAANYRQHVIDLVAAERASVHGRTPEEAQADAIRMMDERIANGTPYLFVGLARAMVGAYDDIVLPVGGEQPDWELELAVVIGRLGRHISPDDAMTYVAGYTICNDITARDRIYRPDLKAIGTDWFAAKNAMTFLPTGPYLVPAAFIADPDDLRITLRHNGVVRQDESTNDMIFGIPQLISYASAITELRPGDLVLTGSPAGNGAHYGTFLADGDVIDAGITGLGHQRNRCVAEERE